MYKRRARIVFLAKSPELEEWVVRRATEMAGDWIEAGSGPQALIDCDLLITLATLDPPQIPPLPPGCRHKHWTLPTEALYVEIEARIQGLIGGMRLLARLDASDAPGEKASSSREDEAKA